MIENIKHIKKRGQVRKMGIPFIFRTFILLVLIYLSDICDLVSGKVSQINFGSRNPFELRTLFPSSPRPAIVFNSGNSTVVFSASNINPMGFDFSKINSPQPRSQIVHYDEKTVIPLAWVNLPLFDTPTFNTHYPTHGERKVQNNSSSSAPLHSNVDIISNNRTRESRTSRNQVVKSDWDGRTSVEIDASHGRNSASTSPPLHLDRRIQLSNRGNTPQVEVRPKVDVVDETQHFGTTEKNVVLKSEDHSFAESKKQEVSTNLPVNHFDAEPTLSSPEAAHVKDDIQPVPRPLINPSTGSPKSRADTNQYSKSNYKYEYAVSNTETMDVKTHSESRDGEVVIGQYTVLEADGYTRIVSYTADASGFRASIRRVKV